MRIKTPLHLAIVLLCMLAVSCKDNDIVYNTDPEGKEFRTMTIALPLGKATVPLHETINKKISSSDSVRIGDGGVLYVQYHHKQPVNWENGSSITVKNITCAKEFDLTTEMIESQSNEDITKLFPDLDTNNLPDDINEWLDGKIPDEENLFSNIPGGILTPGHPAPAAAYQIRSLTAVIPVAYSATGTEQATVTAGGTDKPDVVISKAVLDEGTLQIEISLPAGTTGNVTFTIPALQKDGKTFMSKFEGLTGGTTTSQTYTLRDCSVTLDNGNSIYITYAVDMLCNFTNGAPAKGPEIEFTLEEIKPKYIFGNFGKDTIEKNDGFALEFFKDLEFTGSLGFKDIGITMNVTNNLGLPIGVKGDLIMYNGADSLTTLLRDFGFTIEPAIYTGTTVTPRNTSETFTPSLSLDGSRLPDRLGFAIKGRLNPDNTLSPATDNFLVVNGDMNM
ncbi:MAG: hypothetical protein LBT49_02285, partial [Prevotellaceae bacterium]|nr:hypothetical protein [Prevotellaceae bacterium]